MRLSPMIVQALWNKNKKSDLLQLPHLNENHLRHFVTKKVTKQNTFFSKLSFLRLNCIFKREIFQQ